MLNTAIKPMLLQPDDKVLADPDYIHQLKLDGHRALLHYDNGNIRVYTRFGNDITSRYIEFHDIKLPVRNCILDGEIVCFEIVDDIPKPSFDNVMVRFKTTNLNKIKDYTNTMPVHFSAFDVLYINEESVINRPLIDRIDILNSIVANSSILSSCPVYTDGSTLFQKIKDLDLEGIVSKNLNKPYTLNSRPANTFIKVKNYKFDIVKIKGIRKKKFGWLMLGQDDVYKGVLEFVPPDERTAFYHISKQLTTREDKNYLHLV